VQRENTTHLRPSISAVLPAHNEAANIERSVRALTDVLRGLTDEFEIIVTNDGSSDQTGDILAALERTEPDLNLHVVTHPVNRGYGSALASGFEVARKEFIFFTDSDVQFDVSELADFVKRMNHQTDLVIGWRDKRADSPIRLLNAWGWKHLVNGLFGYTARDVDCAFKLFRRRVWNSLSVRATGATFSAEFLIKSRRLGFRITEIPVSHFPRSAGRPTGAKPTVIARAFKELFQLWWSLDRELCQDPRAIAFRAPR
jgi:glycosyltransferase involved in cell wall biosynthesis